MSLYFQLRTRNYAMLLNSTVIRVKIDNWCHFMKFKRSSNYQLIVTDDCKSLMAGSLIYDWEKEWRVFWWRGRRFTRENTRNVCVNTFPSNFIMFSM